MKSIQKTEPKPKFRVQAKRIRNGVPDELPYRTEYAFKNSDRDIKLKGVVAECPTDKIEVVLMKGFRHDKPLRWEWRDGALKATSNYDKFATKK